MPKEILLYSPMYSYSIERLITQMEEASDEDVTMRLNTPGGEVYYAYGAIAKWQEHKKAKKVKVDGMAFSGGAFFCCYAEDVEAIDVAEFLFHRAAYPAYIERDPEYFTEEMRAGLVKMNKNLRAAMESKIDADKFAEVTGVTLDDLFSLDDRIDVRISAKQAKEIGLINKVVKITPKRRQEIEAMTLQIAAQWTGATVPEATIIKNKIEDMPADKLTLEEIKAQYPEHVQAIQTAAVTAERDRVATYMEFNDIDPVAVKAGIEAGTTMTGKEMAAFSRKAMANGMIEAAAGDNNPVITTTEPEKPEAQAAKVLADFKTEVQGFLKQVQ